MVALSLKAKIEQGIRSLESIYRLEVCILGSQRKMFFYNNGTLNWGEDIPKEKMAKLKDGEVFLLLSKNKQPHSLVCMDFYGQIRQKRLN